MGQRAALRILAEQPRRTSAAEAGFAEIQTPVSAFCVPSITILRSVAEAS